MPTNTYNRAEGFESRKTGVGTEDVPTTLDIRFDPSEPDSEILCISASRLSSQILRTRNKDGELVRRPVGLFAMGIEGLAGMYYVVTSDDLRIVVDQMSRMVDSLAQQEAEYDASHTTVN
jgi:hypothetical protein